MKIITKESSTSPFEIMKILKEDIKLQNKTKIKQQIKVKNFRIFHNSYTIDLEKPNVAHQKISNFLSTCLTENVTVAVNNKGGDNFSCHIR